MGEKGMLSFAYAKPRPFLSARAVLIGAALQNSGLESTWPVARAVETFNATGPGQNHVDPLLIHPSLLLGGCSPPKVNNPH